MRTPVLLTTTAALALAGSVLAQTLSPETNDTADADAQARELTKAFATRLQGELKAGLKEGGPTAAVRVCKEEAPAIAASLSEQSGWQVARTSLKTRNPENAPDEWERQVLEQFDDRQAAGQPVADMTYAAVVEQDGAETYRFMKAIPTAEVCLACHGSDLSPDLVEALDKAYPEDQARGYELGDIRGAFTLSKPL
jgi:hypothetical protein